jgi:hypothetical protein
MNIEVPRIEDETSAWERRPYLERYFTKRFLVEGDGGIYSLLSHSNKIIILTLAPSHPILSKNYKVIFVNYQVTPKLNRLDNKVSGKGKHGGQFLSESSIICEIKCEDETSGATMMYKVRAGIVGKLLEVNEGLVQNPSLLKNPNRGFLAVVCPRLSDLSQKLQKLLAEDPGVAAAAALPPGEVPPN